MDRALLLGARGLRAFGFGFSAVLIGVYLERRGLSPGLIGLTRDLNQQWSGRRGIRVNAVAPGYFRSEMTQEIPSDMLNEFITQTSTLGRMGEQHELDTVVVFLASPASSYIAGVTLAVDGGMSGH